MVLEWRKGRAASVPELLARREFDEALALAQEQWRARPGEGRLQLQLADTLVAAGRPREALPFLRTIADALAADGFAAKAIAVLKRAKKIQPDPEVERQLAGLIAEKSRLDPPAPRPSLAPAPALEIGMEEIGSDPLPLGDADADASAEPDLTAELDLEGPDHDAASPGPSSALFPGFSPDELAALMGGLQLRTFAAGEIVVAEGEPGDSLFLITTGSVKAWIRGRDGRYALVRRLGEGDFFGEISILTGQPRTATIVAASPCELLELGRTALDGITATYPRVGDILRRFSEERLATSADTAPPGAA